MVPPPPVALGVTFIEPTTPTARSQPSSSSARHCTPTRTIRSSPPRAPDAAGPRHVGCRWAARGTCVSRSSEPASPRFGADRPLPTAPDRPAGAPRRPARRAGRAAGRRQDPAAPSTPSPRSTTRRRPSSRRPGLRRSPALLPIPGTSSVAHVEENIGAAGIPLPDSAYQALVSAAVRQPPMPSAVRVTVSPGLSGGGSWRPRTPRNVRNAHRVGQPEVEVLLVPGAGGVDVGGVQDDVRETDGYGGEQLHSSRFITTCCPAMIRQVGSTRRQTWVSGARREGAGGACEACRSASGNLL